MLHFTPSSPEALLALVFCFILVCIFEFANGFHDTANAVATVIYTNTLKPRTAVLWSALMNFIGVLIGGIAVAYTMVELLPPEVLSPPNGDPAVPMLVALFATALAWNLFTWWFGIPNSSSHCVIGALIGIAVGNALVHARNVGHSVDWEQIWIVLRALAVSPLLGLMGAGLLYVTVRRLIKDPRLYEPPHGDRPPVGWIRGLLILTCTSVSFSHGTNDGQKSIGLIMLTVIGLMPATFALNPAAGLEFSRLPENAASAIPLIRKYGDDQKLAAVGAAQHLQRIAPSLELPGTRSLIRDDVYQIIAELKAVTQNPQTSTDDKAAADQLRSAMRPSVEYAPWWVRILSAACLGLGTIIGYKRIVHTLGERIGNTHLTPAQGASAELVGAVLIASAGFTGLPVSTTHIITSGIAGTMIGAGSSLNYGMLGRIALAWIFTLPVTIAVSAGLFYMFAA